MHIPIWVGRAAHTCTDIATAHRYRMDLINSKFIYDLAFSWIKEHAISIRHINT